MPEPINRARTAADSTGMRETPPVSGSSFEGAAVALLVALEDGLVEAEALPAALDVAEALPIAVALEAGLAVALSSIPLSSKPLSSLPRSSAPRASIPLSSWPLSSDWAAATGANTNTAKATDRTSNNIDLRTVSPRFRLRIRGKDASGNVARPIQIYGSFPTSVPALRPTNRPFARWSAYIGR